MCNNSQTFIALQIFITLESVFASLLAFIFADEILPAKGDVWAFVVLTGKIDFKKPIIRNKILQNCYLIRA